MPIKTMTYDLVVDLYVLEKARAQSVPVISLNQALFVSLRLLQLCRLTAAAVAALHKQTLERSSHSLAL
jgi:hypothetical protein